MRSVVSVSAARVFLYFEPVGTTRNDALATVTAPLTCGSRLVPIALTSSVISPLTLRTTSVIPSIRPRLIALDLMARSIGCSEPSALIRPSGTLPAAVIQTPGPWSSRASTSNICPV